MRSRLFLCSSRNDRMSINLNARADDVQRQQLALLEFLRQAAGGNRMLRLPLLCPAGCSRSTGLMQGVPDFFMPMFFGGRVPRRDDDNDGFEDNEDDEEEEEEENAAAAANIDDDDGWVTQNSEDGSDNDSNAPDGS